jgi:hypothetical protein
MRILCLRAMAVAVALLVSGCQVQLVPPFDERIDAGLTAYQGKLEAFHLQTVLNYEKCRVGATPGAEPCVKARYASREADFYLPEEAALRVLKNRAAAFDSIGACEALMEGIAKLATAAIADEQIREWVLPYKQGAKPPSNCTELQIDTVLMNHKLLGTLHMANDAKGDLEAARQATAITRMYETLVQNIRIALFVENAKKRGK